MLSLISSLLQRIRSEHLWKERIITGFITLAYISGNLIEYASGKVAEDPAWYWVTAIFLGIATMLVSISKFNRYTLYFFYTYSMFINFHCAMLYSYGVREGGEAEELYLILAYVAFFILNQAVDSRRALLVYSFAELVFFAISLYTVRDYNPILFRPLHQLIFLIVVVGTYMVGYVRIMRTQINPDSSIQFKAITESARDVQSIINKNLQFVYLNPAISELTGYVASELSGNNIYSIIHPEDIITVRDAMEGLLTGEIPKVNVEYRTVHKAGYTVWVESIISPFKSSANSNELLYFLETRDIEARKQLEAEIQQQIKVEELLIRYSNSFINAPRTEIQNAVDKALAEIGRMVNAEGIIVYRTYGKMSDEFRISNFWLDYTNNDLRKEFNAYVVINQTLVAFLRQIGKENNAVGTQISTDELVATRILNPGVLTGKHLYIVPFLSGTVVNGFMLFIHPVEVNRHGSNYYGLISNMLANAFSRLRAETRLHEAQLTNEFILRALPDWVYIIDKNGQFSGTNLYSSIEPYFPDHDLISKSFFDVLPAEIATQYNNSLHEVMESDLSSTFEYLDTKLRKDRFFKVIIAPFKMNEYLVLIRDVTDLKQAQIELEQKAQKLEQSNKELEEFAYVVSHDMKQPIRTVISYLSLLKKRASGQLNDEAMEYINYSIEGANKMSDLIRDILQYSRMDQQISIQSDVNLNNIVKRVASTLKDFILTNNARIACEELPVVTGNETMLGELFQNLIENGIKYNRSEEKKVTIQVQDKGTYWQFKISDNGIGFDDQYASQIFKIFKRLHTDSEFQGTGIGLTICQKAVEKHGGKIWAHSVQGEGSTFYFTLPK